MDKYFYDTVSLTVKYPGNKDEYNKEISKISIEKMADSAMTLIFPENIVSEDNDLCFDVYDAIHWIVDFCREKAWTKEQADKFYIAVKERGFIKRLNSYLYNSMLAKHAMEALLNLDKKENFKYIKTAYEIVYKRYNPYLAFEFLRFLVHKNYKLYKKLLKELRYEKDLSSKLIILFYLASYNPNDRFFRLMEEKDIMDFILPYHKTVKYELPLEMYTRIEDLSDEAGGLVDYEGIKIEPLKFMVVIKEYFLKYEELHKGLTAVESTKKFMESLKK
jgi:nucleoside diphosphate kinase